MANTLFTTSVLDQVAVRVKHVHELLGIHLVRRGEYNDLKELGRALQKVLHMRTLLHIDCILYTIKCDLNWHPRVTHRVSETCKNSEAQADKAHRKLRVWILDFVHAAVYEGLV